MSNRNGPPPAPFCTATYALWRARVNYHAQAQTQVPCPVCGANIPEKQMYKHTGTKRCQRAAERQAAKTLRGGS